MSRLSDQQRYDLFAKVTKDAIAPAMNELHDLKDQVRRLNDDRVTKEDLRALRNDLAEFRGQTYTREMVDAKFADVKTEQKSIRDDMSEARQSAKEAQAAAGTQTEKLLTRAAIIISSGWILLQALPHLVKAFG